MLAKEVSELRESECASVSECVVVSVQGPDTKARNRLGFSLREHTVPCSVFPRVAELVFASVPL